MNRVDRPTPTAALGQNQSPPVLYIECY